MHNLRFLCALGFYFVSLPCVFAGSITAELDRNRLDLGESAQLSVTISGTLKDDISIPEVPGLSFQQIGTSTNVQITNGTFTKELTYNFAVSADRAGSFQIPSIKASIDKEDLATPPLSILFGPGNLGSSGNPGTGGPGGAAPVPGTPQGEPPFIFIERELSNQTPYEGQAILSTVRIFQRVRVTSMVPERDPAPAWRIISKEGQKTYDATRDSVRWRVIELSEVIIPLKSGDLPPPSFALQTTYLQPSKQRIRRGSIWDLLQGGMMDMGQEVTKKIASDAKPIHVKPLPTEGRPAVVSDMIGDFKLAADVSRRTLNAGETATVSIRVTGLGALDRIADFKLPALVGARVYPDKPQLKEVIDESGLKSSKEYKFAIVPSQAGEHILGSIELGAFNPVTGKWYILKEELGSLSVLGTAQAAPGNGTPAAQSIQNAAPSTSPQAIDTNHNQAPSSGDIVLTPANDLGSRTETNPVKWFGVAVFLLGALGIAVFARPISQRYKAWSATRLVTKTPYGTLKSHLRSNAISPAAGLPQLLAELRRLTAKPEQDPKAMTAKDMVEALRVTGVPSALVTRLADQLESIESSLYRGSSASVNETTITEFTATLNELAQWEKA